MQCFADNNNNNDLCHFYINLIPSLVKYDHNEQQYHCQHNI